MVARNLVQLLQTILELSDGSLPAVQRPGEEGLCFLFLLRRRFFESCEKLLKLLVSPHDSIVCHLLMRLEHRILAGPHSLRVHRELPAIDDG